MLFLLSCKQTIAYVGGASRARPQNDGKNLICRGIEHTPEQRFPWTKPFKAKPFKEKPYWARGTAKASTKACRRWGLCPGEIFVGERGAGLWPFPDVMMAGGPGFVYVGCVNSNSKFAF